MLCSWYINLNIIIINILIHFILGNYYSLMGDHLKAVIYFRKALKLDRNCLAAWTLMGHEVL